MNAPLTYAWDGEAMKPLARFTRLADKQFVVGETYMLGIHEERSAVSHRHYFSCIREAWLNLPDNLALEYTSEDRLRKRALIATGWFTERRLVMPTPAEARKVVSFMMQRADDATLFSVAGSIVIERTARSQRTGAGGMKKAEFQKSKTDVLEWISALIRVDLKTLAANATAAAPDFRMAG
jgi:hypothetical protein